MIKARIPKNQAVMKMVRMFLAHYLTTVQGYGMFQNDSITLLATWITKFIKKLSSRVKSITNMQGRTQSNIFHLMWCLEEQELAPLAQLISFMHEKKSNTNFNHSFFEKLREEVFGDDIEKINKLPEEDRFSNIHYTRKPYTIDTRNEALPFKYLIQQLYPFPPEYSYKTTRKSIQNEEMHNDYLGNMAERESMKVASEFSKKRDLEHEQQEEQDLNHEVIGVKRLKKVNLLSDI